MPVPAAAWQRGRGARAAGGVPRLAGPGAGPVGGVGALLFQAVEGVPGRDRRGGRGQRLGRGPGHRVHRGLDCQDRNTWSAKAMVTSLRAFLRFAHATGRTAVPLAGAVPAVASWRMAVAAPRADRRRRSSGCWPAATGTRRRACRITRSCRCWPGSACGAPRPPGCNSAISTGGLARSRSRGKGSRIERLPLPAPAGEALAAWLTDGRPRCESRSVFVTVRRPYRPLTPERSAVMGRACDRAGLERRGTHRFRHALATEMLRAGASLAEVGQVLRHRSQLSTSVYAKVDQNALRPLARPVARSRAVSALRARAEEYLAMRRALGFKLESHGPRPDELRPVLRGPRRRHGDHGSGGGVGDPTAGEQRRGLPGPPARRGADLRPPPAGAGSGHRGPARGRAGPPPAPGPALPLLPAGDHRADERGQDAARPRCGRRPGGR